MIKFSEMRWGDLSSYLQRLRTMSQSYKDDPCLIPLDLQQDLVHEQNRKECSPWKEESVHEGPRAVTCMETELMTLPVVPGHEQVYLGSSPALENELCDIWVKGPLMVIREGSAKMIY